MKETRICNRCVMDTTDPDIQFDRSGICNHCHFYDLQIKNNVFSGQSAAAKLSKLVDEIKEDGKGKDFDCIIGISGGVDSTFVAYKVKELGLRPLAVHLDNGWDSELAVKNIENVLKLLNIELFTHVIDWEEFKDLQIAFLKASTPDSEIPSDHAIFSIMYQMAEKINVKHILTGLNHRTESHLPPAWSTGHMDWKYIKSIQTRFGKKELVTFPHLSFFKYRHLQSTKKWIDILNYLDYVKTDALEILQKQLDWKYYGGKHYESIYTRFYQGYILPQKFGFDKRKTHFSSLICSGEMKRDQALEDLKKPTYPVDLQKQDREYVIKKFGLQEAEFDSIMRQPHKTYWDYPSYGRFVRDVKKVIDKVFLGNLLKHVSDVIKLF